MRVVGLRVVCVAAVAALAAVLLGGCELREGVDREYGKAMSRAPGADWAPEPALLR